MSDPVVTMADVRRAGFCAAGARRWALRHGIDFRAFMANGIAASRLVETGDGLAARVVASLEGRADG